MIEVHGALKLHVGSSRLSCQGNGPLNCHVCVALVKWLKWTSEHILVLDIDVDHLYYVQCMSRRTFMSTWTNFDEIGRIGPQRQSFVAHLTVDRLISCQENQQDFHVNVAKLSKMVDLYLC